MNLTVGKLREIIEHLPDDVILADLGIGNRSFETFTYLKRVMLMKNKEDNRQYLVINKMGAHFTGKDDQEGIEYNNQVWD